MIEILNDQEVTNWLWDRRNHDCTGIKGEPPEGMTYSNGSPVVNPVNVGWLDATTGEEIRLVYGDVGVVTHDYGDD